MSKMIKIAFLLTMAGACLTYPADKLRPPAVNAAPENVNIVPVPNQPVTYEPNLQALVPADPGQSPMSEEGNPLAKPEEDLTTAYASYYRPRQYWTNTYRNRNNWNRWNRWNRNDNHWNRWNRWNRNDNHWNRWNRWNRNDYYWNRRNPWG